MNTMTVTCLNPACENAGIELVIPATWLDIGDIVRPVEVVQCGPCGQWIIPPPNEGGTP